MKKTQFSVISPLTGENKRGGGIIAIALILLAASISAAPVLVEAYQEGTITIPADKIDTVTVVELSFSVDTSCYVLFTTGGIANPARTFLQLDTVNLFPTAIGWGSRIQSVHITYTYPLTPGNHNIYFKMTNAEMALYATCHNAYLQALIFLPDEPSAVAEQPPETRGLSPLSTSIVSKGPFVHAPSATELVDASGRVIENAIVAGHVQISTLPTGTYFARDGERTVVKIVKVN